MTRISTQITPVALALPAPTIAAVVVTFNRIDALKVTLARLLEEPFDQIIVVDNGSTDGSRDWLAEQQDPRLHLEFPAQNGGGAAGFEIGLRRAVHAFDPDWCLVMDDDARPLPGLVDRFRAEDWHGWDAVSAAVYHPDGQISEMNRPWVNPFASSKHFLKTLFGGGRAAYHIPDSDFTAPGLRAIDGTSFVGLFVSRDAIARTGYPDGRLFIYGDDVLYTLGLSQSGGRIAFAPFLHFEHDCGTVREDGLFRPLWKTYYHRRNLCFVYRTLVGRLLFWPLVMALTPLWVAKARHLNRDERRVYLNLLLLAIRDAATDTLSRSHAEIRERSA